MNAKQRVALLTPPVLIGVMYAVFRVFVSATGSSFVGWYLGLATYWFTWCTILPLTLVGWRRIKALIRPRPLHRWGFALLLIPVFGASLYRLVPGIGYEKQALWITLLYVSTAFGNGFFEELLWRGVYMEMFPNSIPLRMVFPTIAFALWHYAPGAVSANENVWGLIIGAAALGSVQSLLAKQTNGIWWPIVAHASAGLIMVLS
jgi:membrane protease YdiL (CAAX protease family)